MKVLHKMLYDLLNLLNYFHELFGAHLFFQKLVNFHKPLNLNHFRNSNAKVVSPMQGPREPWHDIHSYVEGRIAYDVFFNFYERWNMQGPKDHSLTELLEISKGQDIDINAPLDQDPARAWNCQFFRSITNDSAQFLDTNGMKKMNSKKGRVVDSSIAQAYIQIIRNAEHFIFIENQYFLGSAYAWLMNDDVNCHHTIPSEIAQKVIDKIKANEPFCAYIMIPMFPEGKNVCTFGAKIQNQFENHRGLAQIFKLKSITFLARKFKYFTTKNLELIFKLTIMQFLRENSNKKTHLFRENIQKLFSLKVIQPSF